MHSRSQTCLAVFAFAAASLLAMPAAGHAFGMSGAGGKLGYTSPENLDGTVMVGGHLEFEERATRLHLMPNVMYWRVNRQSDTNPNMDVYYHFNREGKVTPYVGGGLGLNVRNSDVTDRRTTALGANVISGLRFPGRSNHYFVEGRFTASDEDQVALLGGVTFHTAH